MLTEKTRRVRIFAPDGTLSARVQGTPKGHDDTVVVTFSPLELGLGWLFDVAPHPACAQNGWIYLHFCDRCEGCNEASRVSGGPVSMNKIVRGRIRDARWVDEQLIWRAPVETYTDWYEVGAGGRLAFDDAGHVYFSIGIKGGGEHLGIQDLHLPYGKIHRVNDDGSIPPDNPFLSVPGAMPSIWTFGHRSPLGLEYDPKRKVLWETEMGQRGGDELNRLDPGGNYGWPLVSFGLKYDGTAVDYANELGISVDPASLTGPVHDFTPSPAVSSFVIYAGAAFPGWEGDLIIGSLKARTLYRLEMEGDKVVHRETMLSGLGRIRDVATGVDGLIYVLLENTTGSVIVRLVPVSSGKHD